MSTTEDRLIAALAARADQVQPEDLRAPEVPDAAPAVTFLRSRLGRPAAYTVGIAAAAAAIAAPFVIGGVGPSDDPVPPATQTPSPTLEPQPDIGGDWPITQRRALDLDGDGTEEELRLRADGDRFTAARVRLESDLSGSGTLTFGVIDTGGSDYNIVGAVAADADAGSELVLYLGARPDLAVVDLLEGQFVEVERDDAAPLTTGTVTDREVSEDESLAFQTTRWIEDGTLYSSRSARSFPQYGMNFELPDPYLADVWAWQIVDGVLTPQPQEDRCFDAGDQRGRPCGDGEGDDVPSFFPEETELIGVGESFTADVDFDQRDDTIALEGVETDGRVAEGDVELVVSTTSYGEKRFPIPAGATPQVYATTIQIGMIDGLSVLVAQDAGDTAALTYVATGAQGFAGPLLSVPTDGAPFGTGALEDGSTYETWVGADDRMYTRVSPPADPDATTLAPSAVYAWSLARGPRLTAIDLGGFCFDTLFGEAVRCD